MKGSDKMGKLILYGERGIVNGIVLDIKDDIGKQKAFLKAIKFADQSRPGWIDRITGMDFMVEPSFSEFGNPDLILIACETDGTQHVVFIEAKICCYDDAAVKIPVTYEKNASKINIQLMLKYRFAEAFQKYMGGNIEESPTAEYALSDRPRRIKKNVVIKICTTSFKNIAEYSFVALTNDRTDKVPYDDDMYIPPVEDWKELRGKFGLVSYSMLEEANVVDRYDANSYYGMAVKTFMLGLPEGANAAGKDIPFYRTINTQNWTIAQKETAQKLADLIVDSTGCRYKLQNGSYSFYAGAITVAKIFTQNDGSVILALRNDGLPEDYKKHLTGGFFNIGVGEKNAKVFACEKIGPENGIPLELADFSAEYISKRMLAEGE